MGVLGLVAAALGLVALIVAGILSVRTSYFENRNLRELDRIAVELKSTRLSLGQSATLHFVPRQLHFSLAGSRECLVATTRIMGARQQLMNITYAFTDLSAPREAAASSAAPQPPQAPAAAPAAPATSAGEPASTGQPAPPASPTASPAVRAGPLDPCSYQPALARPPDPSKFELSPNGSLRLDMSAPMVNLLWPMSVGGASPPDTADCVDDRTAAAQPGSGPPQAVAEWEPRGFFRRCFVAAALEDIADNTYSQRPRTSLQAAVEQSVDAAIQSNIVRISVTTNISALDLDSALDNFDAVQIIGTVEGQPRLLYQAGRVPVAHEGDSAEQAQALNLVLALGGAPAAGAPAANRAGTAAQPTRQGEFLNKSRVFRTADLVLFQRTYSSLAAGLPCNPCRIVGVVDRTKFSNRARRIDGVQATIFLIAVLTLLGLIPLIQLKLRKRLDATGRAGQYLLWFSLTLLSACASVAALAIWSSVASRNAGAAYATEAISHIRQAFRGEVDESLQLIARIGRELAPSTTIFPAPETLPAEAQLTAAGQYQPNGADPATRPVIDTLAQAPRLAPQAAIIDTVANFRADGFTDRNTARVAVGRFPAFGQNISDRPYFVRARNREYDRIADLPCARGLRAAGGFEFVLDRVFAKQDGAPRAVFVMPAMRGCMSRPPGPGPAAGPQGRTAPPASGTAAAHAGDLQRSYNPTRLEFVVATGTLRTFMRATLAPGFRYAVIDPDRPRGEPDVLYHSLPGAELAERFEEEIDHPAGFRALVDKALADPRGDAAGPRQASALPMDTHYHAQPARLTVARLHPNMRWVLVMIEDRDDAGFAVWRAATFGYAIWFIGAILFALVLLFRHARSHEAMDRRPVLWLWPAARLESFTPPRLDRLAGMKSRIADAAALRDRHMLWVGIAALVGLAAAEGWSRVAFAFAAAAAVLAGRSYFQGLTTSDAALARQSDRRIAVIGLAVLVLALPAFWTAMEAESALSIFFAERGGRFDLVVGIRFLAFAAAVLVLLKCFLAAFAHAREARPDQPEEAGARRPLWHRLQRWKPRRRLPDVGWIVALIVLGGAPAAAGFLDSYDQDRSLLVDRAQQAGDQAMAERSREVEGIDIGRRAKLSPAILDEIVASPVVPAWLPFRPVSNAQAGRGQPDLPPDTSSCATLSCLAMLYLDLREQALAYSDYPPFSLGAAFDPSRGVWRLVLVPLALGLPILVFVALLLFFRREYFSPPPLLSPGKDPDFDPPLSLTRPQFVEAALLEAAAGRPPLLPFAPAGGNRHLILGLDLDIRDERVPGSTQRLGDLDSIQWIDLLDPPEDVTPGRKAVVVGNLDLALQIPDEALVERTFQILNKVSGSAGGRARGDHHVFLLADIDPLDRIALLWEKHGVNERSRLLDGWRWAELIQDFTMFPIQAGDPVPANPGEPRVLRRIREELGVLDSVFARELGEQLYARMEAALARDKHLDNAAEADRITSFITEQMSDHYYKLWASSSEEERVILYSVARGCHLKMCDNRALRSLLARGLLIRVPEYRLINRSFARYVVRVGEAVSIRTSAAELGGTDKIWPMIRYPLAATAASAVVLLQFVAPANANSAVGAVPAVLAFIPALLGRLFQDRGAAA